MPARCDDRGTTREPLSTATCGCPAAPDPRIARRFDEKARPWSETEELPEMVDVSARLLDLLRDVTVRRPTVLELGCGTGGLSVALLQMGACRVTGIDLSPASVAVARRHAAQAGYGDRATFDVGNAADVEAESHDWVVLDRVICCFADAERLVGAAIEHATDRIAISGPESRGWRGLVNRPKWAVEDIWDRARGGCRGYVHDLRRVEHALARAGFTSSASARIGLWHVGVYDRGV